MSHEPDDRNAAAGAPDGGPARTAWDRWQDGDEVPPAEVLAEAPELGADDLAGVIVADQRDRWETGDRVKAEAYFERFPRLAEDPDCAVDVIYNEFLIREERGERPKPKAFLERFPRFREPLGRQFELRTGLDPGEPQPVARIGGFEIREPLGVGATGYVFRAYDEGKDEEVALKVIHGHPLPEDRRRRFLESARAAASLSHPHIAGVRAFGVEPEGCFIAYEYVQGPTLAHVMEERSLAPREAAEMIAKLARAVQHAAGQGVIHPDLKAANVLVDEHGEPRITDFGLLPVEREGLVVSEGAVPGPMLFVSPEELGDGSAGIDERSLVYRLGLILFQALTGRIPFEGVPAEAARQLVRKPPPRPRSINREIPLDLEKVCLQALARLATDRYASPEALADDLERFVAGEAVLAEPPTTWKRILRWAARRPTASSTA